jgi:DHA1 family purine ribonucleoside efflux pump-like MFS transporter/DHA1 family L-arabinose/isopropyl-beta-D-thiogalactopyranoside export protein-like MFS transporter
MGSIFFNALYTRFANHLTTLAIGSLCICLTLMLWASWSVYTLVVVFALWGLAMLCFGILMQSQVIQLAPDATDVASAMHSAIYNVGIGAGALLGSIVVHHLGSAWVGFVGGFLALCALVISRVTSKRYGDAAPLPGNVEIMH